MKYLLSKQVNRLHLHRAVNFDFVYKDFKFLKYLSLNSVTCNELYISITCVSLNVSVS